MRGLNDVFAGAKAEMKSANGYIGAFEMPDEALPELVTESEPLVPQPPIIVTVSYTHLRAHETERTISYAV